ncbi:MAG: hypothetical protein DLM55_09675 [Acidimicrobiales bacterium]|nr:MAG: hypothetical protein DLM55_09675 [Acidimicrobiales bacterium]
MARSIRDIHLSRNAALALVTVIGITVIGLVVYFLYTATHHDNPKQANSSTTVPQRTHAPPLQPGEHALDTQEQARYAAPSAAQTAAVVKQAREFTDAWLSTNQRKDAWLAGIEPYGTSGFNQQRRFDSPGDVPAERRTGEPRETDAGPGFSKVAVPLNSGTLSLEFRYVDDKWLIASYDFDRKL